MTYLEITIVGPPVSHQSKNKSKLLAWKNEVRSAAATEWQRNPPLKVPLQVIVAYYHEGPEIRLDNDNFVKPIQDALNQLIYEDDRQLTDTIIRKTSIDTAIVARGKSAVLLAAFAHGEPFVHIVVRDAPSHANPVG